MTTFPEATKVVAGTHHTMKPPIVYRTELYPGGVERRLKRDKPTSTPSGVWATRNGPLGVWATRNGPAPLAYMYTCPITKHYVVATQGDTRLVGERHFVCYQSFKQRDAAVMYVLSIGG